MNDSFIYLDPTEIVFGERFRQDYGDLQDLQVSIREHGIIQPIVITYDEESRPLLIAGGRRLSASLAEGLTEIPCVIKDSIPELKLRELELEENVSRKDMSYLEMARLRREIHKLKQSIHGVAVPGVKTDGWSIDKTAQSLGLKSKAELSQDIRVAEAVEKAPELFKGVKTRKEALGLMTKVAEEAVLEELKKRASSKTENFTQAQRLMPLIDAYKIGNAFLEVPKLPSQSFDFIEIDPPYAIDLHNNKASTTESYEEIDRAIYPAVMQKLLHDCYDKLKETGWLVLWFAPEPWFEAAYGWLKDAGFEVKRMPGLWVKANAMTNTPNVALSNNYEMFFYARKSKSILAKPGRTATYLQPGVHPDHKIHPTERPLALMDEIIETFTYPGASILVPFGGSGATLRSAFRTGRIATCYDLSEEHKTAYSVAISRELGEAVQ